MRKRQNSTCELCERKASTATLVKPTILLLIYLKQINEIVDSSCYTCTFFNFLSARHTPLHQVVKIVTMVSEDLHRSDAYKFQELFFVN